MKYLEIRKTTQEKINNLTGLFWAFSQEQFNEGLKKLGITQDESKTKLYNLGAGGYILKEQRKEFHKIFSDNEEALKNLQGEDLLQALLYELRNHEFCYTGDPEPALEALGYNKNTIPSDILDRAINQAWREDNG